MASGRPATLARARRAADSSRGTETSRGAERERWHSEAAQRRGPTEVALGGGQGAAGRAGFGRSQAILAGLGDRRGAQLSTRSPCRPPPGSRGPSSAYSRWLQLGTLGKVFCRSCPGRPCTRVLSTVQALRGQGQRWRSRLLCSPCELLRALRRPPGSASAFPPTSCQPGSPTTRDARSVRSCPAPKLSLRTLGCHLRLRRPGNSSSAPLT